jgi:hypothetical protein
MVNVTLALRLLLAPGPGKVMSCDSILSTAGSCPITTGLQEPSLTCRPFVSVPVHWKVLFAADDDDAASAVCELPDCVAVAFC